MAHTEIIETLEKLLNKLSFNTKTCTYYLPDDYDEWTFDTTYMYFPKDMYVMFVPVDYSRYVSENDHYTTNDEPVDDYGVKHLHLLGSKVYFAGEFHLCTEDDIKLHYDIDITDACTLKPYQFANSKTVTSNDNHIMNIQDWLEESRHTTKYILPTKETCPDIDIQCLSRLKYVDMINVKYCFYPK